MKTIETQIKEVQDYFKTKILSGDFDVTEIETHLMIIRVDNYVFRLWIGNLNLPLTARVYEGSFMNLDFSVTEKKELQDLLSEIVEKNKRDTARKKVEAMEREIEDLKRIYDN